MAQIGRVIGVDYGTVRTGLAISDPMGILASALETIQRRGMSDEELARRVLARCSEHGVQTLVVGRPRRTDGRIGDLELAATAFADLLRTTDPTLEVVMQDERYTSVLANRVLRESNVKRDRRRAAVDQIAAEIILQTYLDARRSVV